MMSHGDQRLKSFQGERFAKIMSHADISKMKLSLFEPIINLFVGIPILYYPEPRAGVPPATANFEFREPLFI